jgi:hypothetical protein
MIPLNISHITSSSPEYREVWELREAVLRKPLGLSLVNEDLSRDHQDTIFIAKHQDQVVGCLLLHRLDAGQVQLRAMAVAHHCQGQGVGRNLVQAAEVFCKQQGFAKIVLHARKVAMGFYVALGYSAYGDEYIEVGIPHYMMEKHL